MLESPGIAGLFGFFSRSGFVFAPEKAVSSFLAEELAPDVKAQADLNVDHRSLGMSVDGNSLGEKIHKILKERPFITNNSGR